MKLYFLYVLFLASVVTALTSNTRFEAGLLRLVEECKTGNLTSLRSLPIAVPSLNPLMLPAMTFTRDFTMTLSELTVTGVENMSVLTLATSLNDLSMSVKFSIPSLAARADWYNLQASWLFYPINDVGKFTCYIKNLVGRGTVSFKASGNDTVITRLELDYTIGDVKVLLDGSGPLVNYFANRRIRDLINERQLVEHYLMEHSRRYLQGHTPQQYIEIISTL